MMVMMTHTTTEYDGESVSNDIHEEDGELVFKWILKQDDFVFFWMINENELGYCRWASESARGTSSSLKSWPTISFRSKSLLAWNYKYQNNFSR